MNTKSLFIATVTAVLCVAPSARAQGDLDPPSGTPTPTMRTLNELFDAIGGVTPLAPSSLIELSTVAPVSAGSTASLARITDAGASAGTYTIPDGQVLVITDLQIFPESFSETSVLTVQLKQGTTTRRSFRIPGRAPFCCDLRTGMTFAPGTTLSIVNGSPGGSSSFRAFLHGYLTTDE